MHLILCITDMASGAGTNVIKKGRGWAAQLHVGFKEEEEVIFYEKVALFDVCNLSGGQRQ